MDRVGQGFSLAFGLQATAGMDKPCLPMPPKNGEIVG